MSGANVISHPLVQHKLSIMRDKSTSTQGFRRLLREISTLLCYEVTRDLPLVHQTIETPLAEMQAPTLAGKKLVLPPSCAQETACLKACWIWSRPRVLRMLVFIVTLKRCSRLNTISNLRKI